jgi:hypothetical protein
VQTTSLDDLLIAAGEAPPESRIEFRDSIAAFGREAVDRLVSPEWIGDPKYAAFAIRTITKAAAFGAKHEAVNALRGALATAANETQRADIASALAALGDKHTGNPSKSAKAPRVRSTALSLEDLVIGRCYSRTELHDSLGGNRETGISYPAGGNHCLLFSDPGKVTEYGYADAPMGEDGYRYFGHWYGSGDMTMARGNKAVLERSPELYLFTSAKCGHVFRGRFECIDWENERAAREGRSDMAIVFNLRRVQT